MGIHYDYKSTRGDKAMKKEAKRKARIEQRRAKRSVDNSKVSEEKLMHDIDKPITGENIHIFGKNYQAIMDALPIKEFINNLQRVNNNLKHCS